MGLIKLIVTVCALSLPSQCEDQHFSFLADMLELWAKVGDGVRG